MEVIGPDEGLSPKFIGGLRLTHTDALTLEAVINPESDSLTMSFHGTTQPTFAGRVIEIAQRGPESEPRLANALSRPHSRLLLCRIEDYFDTIKYGESDVFDRVVAKSIVGMLCEVQYPHIFKILARIPTEDVTPRVRAELVIDRLGIILAIPPIFYQMVPR
jgi:hypothetical protein